jgi:GNAT superfamily N-acetyltransferase
VTLVALDAAQFAEFGESELARLVELRVERSGVSDAHATSLERETVNRWFDGVGLATGTHLLHVVVDGRTVGTCCFLLNGSDEHREGFVFDMLGAELDDHNVPDLRDALVNLAHNLNVSELMIRVTGENTSLSKVASCGDHQLVATRMICSLRGPAPRASEGPEVLLDPMTDDEFAEFQGQLVGSYAEDLARSGTVSHEQALERSRTQTESLLASGRHSLGHFLFTVRHHGDAVGVLWLFEERSELGARGFVYDVAVDAAYRRRGLGRAVMVAGELFLRERDLDYVELNVFGFNDGARRLYRSLGYQIFAEFESVPLRE